MQTLRTVAPGEGEVLASRDLLAPSLPLAHCGAGARAVASEPISQRSDVFDKWLVQDNFVTPGLTCSYVRGPPLYPNRLL